MRYFIETYGCQMNDRDSERMAGMLAEMGYERSDSAEDADVVLINTCSVRAKPEHKVYSALGRLKDLKQANPNMVIGVTGCVAQQEGEKMLKKVPHLDVVIGTRSYHKLPELVSKVAKSRERISETEMIEGKAGPDIIHAESIHVIDGAVSAIVSIMNGCNNYCAFCIVPYVRGPEVSRPSGEILKEIRGLVDNGIVEVMLIGQNVNSYGLGNESEIHFPELLRKVAEIDGIERIRFTTSHPKDFSDELIDTIAGERKICNWVHLPAQSGSSKILKLMRRGYTKEQYLGLIERLNKRVEGVAISSDLIVGFPGETDEDFDETLDLINRAGYDTIYSFKYSPRPDTLAAGFDGQLPEDIKLKRLQTLQKKQDEITGRIREGYVGKQVEVLVVGPDRSDQGNITGRTTTNIPVNFPGSKELVGKLVEINITRALRHSLEGKAVKEL